MKEVTVLGLMMDPASRSPVVVLKENTGEGVVPIWIGPAEALAIQCGLENSVPERPMTHDLFCDTIRKLGAVVPSIQVTDVRDDTFYARIFLDRGGEKIWMDSRPSDAIAVAVRFGARIFVCDEVFEKIRLPSSGSEGSDKWSEILENLGPEAFGKYKV